MNTEIETRTLAGSDVVCLTEVRPNDLDDPDRILLRSHVTRVPVGVIKEGPVGRILRPVTISDIGPERFSFRLSFEKRRSDGIITSVAVMVSDVSWDLTERRHLMIEVLVRLKAKLQASKKVYKRCLTDDGSIIVQAYKNTNRDSWRPLVVSLKVFAVAPAGKEAPSVSGALAGGLVAVRSGGWLSDVVLSVGGRDFPAHRIVLAAMSDVFRRMLVETNNFKEARDGRVTIEDVPADLFSRFLDFLYSAQPRLVKGYELELLALADRYMVESLRRCCADRLLEMDAEKAVSVLKLVDSTPTMVPDELVVRAAAAVIEDWDVLSTSSESWAQYKGSLPASASALLDAAKAQFDRLDE